MQSIAGGIAPLLLPIGCAFKQIIIPRESQIQILTEATSLQPVEEITVHPH